MLFSVSAKALSTESVSQLSTDRNELLFQAQDHQFVLSINPNVSQLIYVSSAFTESIFTQSLGFGIEYGFTKSFSLSFFDDYGSATTKIASFESTATGFSNYVFTAKSTYEVSSTSQLMLNFILGVSPGNTNSSNRYYGGNIYTPQIAFQRKYDESSTLSFKFDNTFYGPATYDGGITTKGTFSSQFSCIFETKKDDNKFGGQLGLTHYYTGGDFTNYLLLTSYASFNIKPNFRLMPMIGYTAPIDALTKKAGVKEDDLFSLQLNTRYAF